MSSVCPSEMSMIFVRTNMPWKKNVTRNTAMHKTAEIYHIFLKNVLSSSCKRGLSRSFAGHEVVISRQTVRPSPGEIRTCVTGAELGNFDLSLEVFRIIWSYTTADVSVLLSNSSSAVMNAANDFSSMNLKSAIAFCAAPASSSKYLQNGAFYHRSPNSCAL